MSMKNPLTPAGIDPATFRFVAQHLNHCATAEGYTDKMGKTRHVYGTFVQESLGNQTLYGRIIVRWLLRKQAVKIESYKACSRFFFPHLYRAS